MPSGKTEERGFRELSALAGAQPEEVRTRRTAADATLMAVRARLGAPGTYDLPGAVGSAPSDTEMAAGDALSVWDTKKAESYAATTGGRKIKEKAVADIARLSPEKYTEQLEKSAEFRLMSRLTAEAEQLVAREGPLYDEMIKNVQLPIIEGNAAMARENSEALRRAAQRGGSARRHAMEAVQKIRAQEERNRTVVSALAKSRFEIDTWARTNARTQLEFNQNWAANLGGIREEFNRAMDGASELMVTAALPMMFKAQQEAAKWRYYAHSQNRSKIGKVLMGVGAIVAGATGNYGLALQLGSQALAQEPNPTMASYGEPGGGINVNVGDLQFGGVAGKIFGNRTGGGGSSPGTAGQNYYTGA